MRCTVIVVIESRNLIFLMIYFFYAACRNAAVRQKVAEAVRKAMVSVKEADISANNLVVRFSESVDGFPLPKGFSDNPDLSAEQKAGAEAFLKDRE